MINDISAARAGYAATSQPITATQRLQPTGETSSERIRDELSLSPLGSALSNLHGVEPRADGSVNIEDIRDVAMQRLNSFKGRLAQLMKEAGIDRSQDAVLQYDALGNVFVANDHPDKDKIEELFQENPQLAESFRGIAGMMELLRAADEGSKFSKAYAKDPYEAVRLFSHLFDNRQDTFNMRIGMNDIEPFFSAG